MRDIVRMPKNCHGKIVDIDCFRPKMDPEFFFCSVLFEDGTLWEVIHDPDKGWVPFEKRGKEGGPGKLICQEENR